MPISRQVENLDDTVRDEAVIEKEINGTTFYLVNPESSYADPMLRGHHAAEKGISDKIEPLVREMKKDKAFREFLSVNLQEFIKSKKRKYPKFIEESDFPTRSVHRVRRIGFIREGGTLVDQPEKANYFQSLTAHYKKQLQRLNGSDGDFDHEKHLFEPVKRVSSLLECGGCLQKGKDYVGLTTKPQVPQSFVQSQQLHILYEQYINFMLDDVLPEEEAVIENPSFIVAPNLDDDGNLRGYLELDGFLFPSDGNYTLIECKNSRYIKQNHLSKFLGKARILEDVYDIQVQKYLVSTGQMGWMVNGLRSNGLEGDIEIFSLENHRNNYDRLVEQLS